MQDLRIRVLHPKPAQKEEEVPEMIEKWHENMIRWQQLDKASERFPEEFLVAALRTIPVGTIKNHVDVKCSAAVEPSLKELLEEYAGTAESKDRIHG